MNKRFIDILISLFLSAAAVIALLGLLKGWAREPQSALAAASGHHNAYHHHGRTHHHLQRH